MLNNTGERPHPCLTPLFICIGSDIQSLNLILIDFHVKCINKSSCCEETAVFPSPTLMINVIYLLETGKIMLFESDCLH